MPDLDRLEQLARAATQESDKKADGYSDELGHFAWRHPQTVLALIDVAKAAREAFTYLRPTPYRDPQEEDVVEKLRTALSRLEEGQADA